MKKFKKLLESKDLSYIDFFGNKVEHNESFKKMVMDSVINIITEENNISEKSFGEYQKIIDLVKSKFNDDMFKRSLDMYNNGKRINYISEIIYDENFK